MEIELTERVIQSLDRVEKWVESGESFINEQAPLVVQDIINWGVYGLGIAAIVATVICILAIVLGVILLHKFLVVESNSTAVLPLMLGTVLCVVIAFGGAIVVSNNAPGALKASIAPRVFVLEQLGSLKSR